MTSSYRAIPAVSLHGVCLTAGYCGEPQDKRHPPPNSPFSPPPQQLSSHHHSAKRLLSRKQEIIRCGKTACSPIFSCNSLKAVEGWKQHCVDGAKCRALNLVHSQSCLLHSIAPHNNHAGQQLASLQLNCLPVPCSGCLHCAKLVCFRKKKIQRVCLKSQPAWENNHALTRDQSERLESWVSLPDGCRLQWTGFDAVLSPNKSGAVLSTTHCLIKALRNTQACFSFPQMSGRKSRGRRTLRKSPVETQKLTLCLMHSTSLYTQSLMISFGLRGINKLHTPMHVCQYVCMHVYTVCMLIVTLFQCMVSMFQRNRQNQNFCCP